MTHFRNNCLQNTLILVPYALTEYSCYLIIVWRKSYDPFFSLNFSSYHLYHLL